LGEVVCSIVESLCGGGGCAEEGSGGVEECPFVELSVVLWEVGHV